MINAYFGIEKSPFNNDTIKLLKHQQLVHDSMMVHSRHGGFCLLVGEPGTGKSSIKQSLEKSDDKLLSIVSVGRTMHTYTNTIKVLCQAFQIDLDGDSFKCEKRLIEEARSLYRKGKSIIIIIDEAQLMETETLRKLRLVLEEFPKNHNLILIGQPQLLDSFALKSNEDIKSRITFSEILRRLTSEDIASFILKELEKVGLPHSSFTDEALALICRSAEGIIRKARNICLSAMIEAVRNDTKVIDIDIINAVLMQPHWRLQTDMKPLEVR